MKKVIMTATIVVLLLVVSLILPVRARPPGQGPAPRPAGPTDETLWADDGSYITLAALSTIEPDDTGLLSNSPGIPYGLSQQSGGPAHPTDKRAPQVQGRGQIAPAEVEAQASISESFEGGVVPPDGWTLIQTNDETWKIGTYYPYSGNYLAHVLYDSALGNQDEVLLSPAFMADSGDVSLWSKGSLYWCRDTYDNCDLEVWLVNGSWDAGGDDVCLGLADNDWAPYWAWRQSTFNFNAQRKPVRIAFRYVGKNGAEIGVDDIQIAYTPPKAFLPIILRNY